MHKSFGEFLEKTQGYPQDQKDDIKNVAETLIAIELLTSDDLQKEVGVVVDNLPDIRHQRADEMREQAKDMKKEYREEAIKDADRLDKSADKLAKPDVEEQFKNRAVLTELSFRLRSRVSGVEQRVDGLDPDRLRKFKMAMSRSEESMSDSTPSVNRHQTALFAFATEIRSTGFQHTDLAVDNFYKNVFGPDAKEKGHLGDNSIDAVEEGKSQDSLIPVYQHTQDYLSQRLSEEDDVEHMRRVSENRVLGNMHILAAENLQPPEYAAFRVIQDNDHLVNWNIDKDGQLAMHSVSNDSKDQSNTIAKILQREMEYKNLRGAHKNVRRTLDKMNTILKENGMDVVEVSEKAKERMAKTTREVLDDPESKAGYRTRGDKDKGKGI